MQSKQAAPPFDDGAVTIYRVSNGAAPGDMPAEKPIRLGVLHYHRRTIGVQRRYLALQAQAKLDLLLRCPYRIEVSAQDVAVPTLDGHQYRITDIQVPEDIQPPVMDLTLERLEADYAL